LTKLLNLATLLARVRAEKTLFTYYFGALARKKKKKKKKT
jgi:hypothetical protein